MKAKILYLSILLILAAVCLRVEASVSDYSKEHPLLFGIDMNYPPLEYIDEKGLPQGFDIDFTKQLMQRLGIVMTYSPNTWENIAGDVIHGRVDLGMMVYSPYRKDSTNYSRAVFRLYYQILYRKDASARFDVRNLSGKKVACMASRPVRDTLTRVGAQLYEVTDLSQATKDLSHGSYDALICFRYQADYLINKFSITNLEAEDLTLAPREYCYVSHSRELIDLINAELMKMDQEGLIDAVYGDIAAIDEFKVPNWVWWVLAVLVFVFMVVFIILQQVYQRRLRKEMRRAQLGERMKTTFLGNVSHALRTPLNSIIGFSDILKDDNGLMSVADRRHISTLIHSSGRQLLYFIDEILELSRIEGNEMHFNRAQVSLNEVMQSYVREVTPKLQPGVSIVVEGDVNSIILVDEQLMRYVTMHFLENAVRYTSQGTITLIYRAGHGELYIAVKDTGPGVAEKLRANIFNLLTDDATYVQSEVPGLGLTICRSIVERCGGKIGLEQPPEGGSLFWHTVPVKVYS